MTDRPPTGRRLLLTLAVWLGIGAVVVGFTILGVRLAARGWASEHRADVGAIILAESYLALLAALLLAFGGRAGVRDILGFRYTTAADLALAILLWLVALFVGGLLTSALAPLIGQPQSNTLALLGQSFDPLFVGIVVPTVCLLAPVAEELLFRGALFGWLARLLPTPLAIIVTAAAFAGAHLLPTLLPILFVFGVAATWIRARTGSTLNSFAMHATQNIFAVAITYAVLRHGVPGP